MTHEDSELMDAMTLPRGSAWSLGVDPTSVLEFLDAVEADETVELHSLMLVRRGKVAAEGWWAPHTPDRRRLLYSLSKSFASTALGFAVGEGLVDLDDTVISHFPELDEEVSNVHSRALKVRHIAAMASGHHQETWTHGITVDPENPVRAFLLTAPDEEPGSFFAYNSSCTYTLARIVQRSSGMSLTQYLKPRLFDPLGIRSVGWWKDSWGHEVGYSGLFARTEDIAKLGQLYLQRGTWGGTQLLPRTFVDQATSAQVSTVREVDGPDWRLGYGFQFWAGREGFRGDGAFGQFCIVLPEHDAVIALTSETENMQAIVDHVWEWLVPGLAREHQSKGAQNELETRLGSLTLPSLANECQPTNREAWEAAPFDVSNADAWDGRSTSIHSVRISHRPDGRITLTIAESDDVEVTFGVGDGQWVLTEPPASPRCIPPVAASGGFVDAETARFQAIFPETPHRMEITCSLPGRTASVRWRIRPLDSGRLSTLVCPDATQASR